MNIRTGLTFFAIAAACTVLVLHGPAASAAQASWPVKPVRVIVPFPPGGGSDFVMRTIAPQLSEQLGQPVLVDNRPGAQGVVGTQIVARAANDGYTLAIVDAATVIMPLLMSPPPFDLIKEFAEVAILVENPFLVTIHPGLPATSMAEFVKLVQANPGKYNYGSGSANSHIAQAVFFSAARLNLTHVPYRGNGPLMVAALGNEVQVNFTGPGTALPFARSGKLRLVAVTSIKRFREAPDAPTLDEVGFKGTDFRSWLGMLAPAGTPRPVIERLNGTINRILVTGPASQVLLDRGYDLNPGPPEAFGKFLGSEFRRVSRAIKEFGIKGQP